MLNRVGRLGRLLWRCGNVASMLWKVVDVAEARGRPQDRVHAGIEGNKMMN